MRRGGRNVSLRRRKVARRGRLCLLPAGRRGKVSGRHGAAAAIVEACARCAERDLVAVLEHSLAANALAVDVGAVQAAEIAQDELLAALLDDAVLFGDDLVEQLDGVVGVAAERVDGRQIERLLATFRGH